MTKGKIKKGKDKFVTIEAIEGSIIVTPKEIKAFKKHGIDLAIALKKIQKELYGSISKHW